MGRFLVVGVLLFIGTMFTGLGAVFAFYFGKPMIDNAKASTEWPATDGEVIESELERSRGDKGKSMYSALIVYRYALDGAELESDRVWFGADYSSSNRAEIKEIVDKYPAGKKITVFYNPDDPSVAVLEPGAFTSTYLMYVIGLVFFVIGCGLLLGAIVAALGVFRSRPDAISAGPGLADRFSADRLRSDSGGLAEDEYEYRDPLAGDDSYGRR